MALQPFALPNELLLASVLAQFPCRERQIRALATLLSPSIASFKNIVIHGSIATGKTAVTTAVLAAISRRGHANPYDLVLDSDKPVRYAIIDSAICITGRHLLETIVTAVADAVSWTGPLSRCESLAQLASELGRLLEGVAQEKFILVFDGIDRQKDASPTLLQALARLGETMTCLTTVFIVTHPRPHFLHVTNTPHLEFPAYTKIEALQILSLYPMPLYPPALEDNTQPLEFNGDVQVLSADTKDIWLKFCAVVWDTLSKHCGRDLLSFRDVCQQIWPAFTSPIRDGSYGIAQFSRLLVLKRSLLQDEDILVPKIVSRPLPKASATTTAQPAFRTSHRTSISLIAQLPFIPRLILIASYLASYTPARNDLALFSKGPSQRKRKKGGGTALSKARANTSKHRKISRKLLGPQAWVMERMMAIFQAVRLDTKDEFAGVRGILTADVPMAIATLSSLRLLLKTSASADVLDAGTKWKVNVGWDVARAVARSVGVEIEDYLMD